MNEIKFVQCGDVHLNMPFSSLKTGKGYSDRRRRQIEDTFYRIIKQVKMTNADFLFICGDLYEDKYTGKHIIDNINYELKKIPNTRIVIIPGNHDPYKTGSFYNNYNWNKNVYILSNDKPYIEFTKDNTAVYNYNAYINLNKTDDIKLKDKYINILMFHGTVDTICNDEKYFPVSSGELEKYGFDYIATGHFHNKILKYGENKTIYNAGSPSPLGFDEEGEHIIITGNIKKSQSKTKVSADIKKVSQIFYKTLEISVSPKWSENQIADKIEKEILKLPDYENMICRIVLKGRKNMAGYINLKRISRKIESLIEFADIQNRIVPEFDIESIKNEPGIRGEFARNITEKIDKETSEEQKTFYRNVLYLGLEALAGNPPNLQKD